MIVVVLLILMELFKLSFDNMSILLYYLKIEIRIMEIQLTFHLEARNLISNVVIKTNVITMFNLRYLQKIRIVLFSYLYFALSLCQLNINLHRIFLRRRYSPLANTL